ncbi:AAA family ATPase [Actinopolyspora halophila]|uniref:AAA family ATPase n=1 Tax=Actinopolyspora halophila TaxID=1850 RepID=UPI00036D1ECA|nr:AAA family ATPase [Actinopolyspora halophila]
MSSSFSIMTHTEALKESEESDVWVIDHIVSASSTIIYGETESGKSFLVSALIASLTTGQPFLEREVPQDRDFSVAVCWTDDRGAAEYSSRIQSVMPEGAEPNVKYYGLPIMQGRDMWRELRDAIIDNGHNFVVIDNLTQCLNGSMNQDEVVREFFDGVRMFTGSGIPVVIVGHSSDKSGMNGVKSDKPMGSALVSQSVRWRCFARRSRKGNLTLKFSGNHAEPYELVLKHGAGARFSVEKTRASEELEREDEARKRNREQQRMDETAERAQWVVQHCQGLNTSATARKLAEQFGGSSDRFRKDLSERKLSKLLTRTEGDRWALAT